MILTKCNLENNFSSNKIDENDLKYFVIENKTYEIKKIINENYKFSKMLLNDFESIEHISEYISKYYNPISDINELNLNVYFKTNSEFNIILENIPLKRLFIDYLDNIEKIILYVISILKEKISYQNHINQLYYIEYFLRKLDFSENVYYDYKFLLKKDNENSIKNYCIEKFLIKDFENYEYSIKNVYKILKYSYDKILKILYNIIEKNNFKPINFDFENF